MVERVLTMNVAEAMKFKTKIQTSCGIDVKMFDKAEDGLVLCIERKALDVSSYKLLADFAKQNELSLQLDNRGLHHFYAWSTCSMTHYRNIISL
jgi:hypothetical protein